ncbi:MAG: TIGR00180 family glycosyltransferase [Methylococcaceae bacterium]
MDLKSVSVIIPAHNRPEKLRRLLRYYLETNIHIIVTDSSANVFPYLEEFPGLNYFHFPKAEFLFKIHRILPLIDTKYVVYCADDDFIVPQGIEQVISFLDSNPDYDSAQGHYLSYEVKKNRIEFYPRYIRNFEKDTNQATADERLKELKKLYASLLYSVVRSTTFVGMYEQCCKEDGKPLFSNLFLAEMYFNLFTLMEGKNKTLPVFYGAREKDYKSATYTTTPLSVIRSSPDYKEEYQSFFNLVVGQLVSKQSMNIEKAENLLLEILQDPKEDPLPPFKRKLLNLLEKYGPTEIMQKFFMHQYKAKGLKNTKGMKSYPITFSTPEKETIIRYISTFK